MINRVIFFLCCCAIVLLFGTSSVLATSIEIDEVNSTFSIVSIEDADNLYAYEINFDYTGNVPTITSANFLGAGASYGTTTRNSILKVYGSRLDSSQTGISGSGYLFNVTYNGEFALRYTILADSQGEEEIEYFNSSGGSDSGGSSGSSGGSSGSSGSSDTSSYNLVVSPSSASVTVAPYRLVRYNVTITNRESSPIVVSIFSEGFNGTLTIPSTVTVPANSDYVLTLIFEPVQRGLITGSIFFMVGNQRIGLVESIVNVQSENFLFDSSISLASRFRTISPGEMLHAQINLLQVGRPNDKIDVVANYIIKDFSGRSYLEDSETFYVEGQKEYVKEFATQHLPEGKYILGLEVVYANAFATSSVQFEVKSSQVKREWFLAGAFILLLVIVGIALYWALSRRKTVYRSLSRGGKN